ncbi:hypothetical protein NQ315_012618, partial [Exocentrus adspersus]
ILTNRPVSMVLDVSEIRTAWQDSDFITDCLCWHNVYRQRHASPPLTIRRSFLFQLCYLAQTWANHLAHTNKFYYRNDKDIGQNLFCRPSNGLVQDVSGHFTQLVWVGSTCCGVGKACSRTGKIVVVAHYAPP